MFKALWYLNGINSDKDDNDIADCNYNDENYLYDFKIVGIFKVNCVL